MCLLSFDISHYSNRMSFTKIPHQNDKQEIDNKKTDKGKQKLKGIH